jgi:EPS-associated MarR family transcriptional regulator
MHSVSNEIRYRLLKHLADEPNASQRDLARALDVSVGKVNYCLRALMKKGLLKVRNFKNSRNKTAYLYLLTPKGIEEKVNVTKAFLQQRMAEYDAITVEIQRLTQEVQRLQHDGERQSAEV